MQNTHTHSHTTTPLTRLVRADPHPGNVAVDASGRLIYYDMGMMGRIPGNVRTRLLDVFYGIYRADASQVITALVELGVITPTGDSLSIRRAINYFISNIQRQTQRDETIQVCMTTCPWLQGLVALLRTP